MKATLFVCAASALLIALTTPTIMDLGTLGGVSRFASTLNDRGQVTGVALNDIPDPYSLLGLGSVTTLTQTHGFLWQHGKMKDLGNLGGDSGLLRRTGLRRKRGHQNRPNVEGCDYSMVEAAAAAQSAVRRYVSTGTQRLHQSRRSDRYHIPGLQSSSR